METKKQFLPILTIAVIVITLLGALFQLINPAVFPALNRDPAALAAGQWWRIVTPLLVLDGNLWVHIAVDTIGFVLVGMVVERLLGRGRWLILFIGAGLAGEIAGYAWDPYGAGASVALFGLLGGLVIWQIRAHRLELLGSIYTVGVIIALAAGDLASSASDTVLIIASAVSAAIVINILMVLRGRARNPRIPPAYVGLVTMIGGLLLALEHDIHGAALLVGLLAGVLVTWGMQPAPEAQKSAP